MSLEKVHDSTHRHTAENNDPNRRCTSQFKMVMERSENTVVCEIGVAFFSTGDFVLIGKTGSLLSKDNL